MRGGTSSTSLRCFRPRGTRPARLKYQAGGHSQTKCDGARRVRLFNEQLKSIAEKASSLDERSEIPEIPPDATLLPSRRQDDGLAGRLRIEEPVGFLGLRGIAGWPLAARAQLRTSAFVCSENRKKILPPRRNKTTSVGFIT